MHFIRKILFLCLSLFYVTNIFSQSNARELMLADEYDSDSGPELIVTKPSFGNYEDRLSGIIDDKGEYLLFFDRENNEEDILNIREDKYVKHYIPNYATFSGFDTSPTDRKKIIHEDGESFSIKIDNENKITFSKSKVDYKIDTQWLTDEHKYLVVIKEKEKVIFSCKSCDPSSVKWNSSGKMICVRGNIDCFLCYDVDSETEYKIFSPFKENEVWSHIYSEDGKYIYFAFRDNTVKKFDKTGDLKFSIDLPFFVRDEYFTIEFVNAIFEREGGLYIIIYGYPDGSNGASVILSFEKDTGKFLTKKLFRFGDDNDSIAKYSDYIEYEFFESDWPWAPNNLYRDKDYMAYVSQDGIIKYNFKTGKSSFFVYKELEYHDDYFISSCGICEVGETPFCWCFSEKTRCVYIINLDTFEIVNKLKCEENQCIKCYSDNTKSGIFIVNIFEENSVKIIKTVLLDENQQVICDFIWNLDVRYACIYYSHIFAMTADNQFLIYDLKSKKLLKKFSDVQRFWFPENLSNLFMVKQSDSLTVYDRKSLEKIQIFQTADEFRKAKFDFYFTYLSKTGFIIQDIFDGSKVLEFNVFSSSEYLTYTPEGFFSGTEWACKNCIYIVDGLKITELNQMYDKLYRPDLISAKIRGEDISEYTNECNFASLVRSGTPPVVSFLEETSLSEEFGEYTFEFVVEDCGGGIGDVRFSLNENTKIPGASRPRVEGNKIIYKQTVPLQNGVNKIEIFAKNKAGTIESLHKSLSVEWNGKIEKPNLYVLTLGINQYKVRRNRLEYAVPDAQAIASQFRKENNGLYENISISSLLDGEVTKDGISAKFDELSHQIKKSDVFILYMAGHGITYNGDYYYIPVDYYASEENQIEEMGISKNDFVSYLSKIDAGKSLILIDTCDSGSFMSEKSQFNTRGSFSSSDGVIRRLRKAVGCAVISAAKDNQSALEGYEGHGIFTYAILEALKGQADFDKDGYISINELSFYLKDEVPKLTDKFWNYYQVPQAELPKDDFPLVEAGK